MALEEVLMAHHGRTFQEGKIERTKEMLKLTGPAARKSFDGYTIEIWTKRDHEDRWNRGDKERFRRLALEAYESRPASAPNPALVPLDEGEEGEEGGPYVYALIRLEVPDVLRTRGE